MSFDLKFWGVRGSIGSPPTPQSLYSQFEHLLEDYVRLSQQRQTVLSPKEFLDLTVYPTNSIGYGGHTSCVELLGTSQRLIIDGGSGIKNLGDVIMSTGDGYEKEIHILMTHFHWDHLVGLPFFAPFYAKRFKIHIYSVQDDCIEAYHTVFRKPYHPVAFESLAAKLEFHQLKPRELNQVNGFDVYPYMLDHPDPCWGFKIIHDQRTLSYCVDHEGVRQTREQLGLDAALFQDVHTLIFDGQYSQDEMIRRKDWGHSTPVVGIDIALREKIENVYFVHHDPSHTDQDLRSMKSELTEYLLLQRLKPMQRITLPSWSFAVEGETIKI